MSEEKPRLSRREMREQGLLKIGREDEQVSPDDLLTRTSELHLRRPSRREMRLQREANEAKTAEQSAKLSLESSRAAQVGTQEEGTTGSSSVHSFSFPTSTTPSPGSNAQVISAFSGGVPVSEQAQAEKSVEDVKGAVSQEKSAGASERSSVFDRFHTKDKEAISFRDRLVARTRERQLEEVREEQPVLSSESPEKPDKQVNDFTQFFETLSDKSEARSAVLAEDDSTVESSVKVEKATSEISAEEDLRDTREKMPVEAVEKEEYLPEDATSAETDTLQVDSRLDDKATDVEREDSPSADAGLDSPVDFSENSNKTVAVVGDGRYPTDVTMRIGGDDEEKTTKDRLVSALIILVGLLIGVILGLIVRKVIFGAESTTTESVDTVQACVLDYEVSAEFQLGL